MKGGFSKKLFEIAYDRRLQAVNGSWLGAWGPERVLWDFLVFKKVRAILGGQIRFLLSGGAPLSGDTQRFINICLGFVLSVLYFNTLLQILTAFSIRKWFFLKVIHLYSFLGRQLVKDMGSLRPVLEEVFLSLMTPLLAVLVLLSLARSSRYLYICIKSMSTPRKSLKNNSLCLLLI